MRIPFKTYSKPGFAKLYTRKTPLTTADILNDRVIPFFDEHEIHVDRIMDACVMAWTQEEATMELTARLQVISLGHQKRGRG